MNFELRHALEESSIGGFIIVSWRDAMAGPLRSLRRDRRWYQRARSRLGNPLPCAPWTSGSQDAGPRWRPPPAGLGLGAARALVADGVDVAICGRDPDRLAGAVAELEALGGGAGPRPGRRRQHRSTGAEAFVAEATEALGGIDILVPNAGGPPAGGFATTDLAAYGAGPRAEPAVDRGHVPGRRARHAGAGLGPGGRDHLACRCASPSPG